MTLEMRNNRTNRRRRKNWRYTRDDRFYDNGKELRLLEKMFWHYNEIKREVEEIRAEMGYYQSHKSDGGGSSNRSFISDPTASAAIKRAGDIHKVIINSGKLDEDTILEPEKWIVAIEQTMLCAKKREPHIFEVLDRRFIKNEPMPTTCIDLEISKDKYYRLRDAGLYYAKECAIQLGLIKVFEDAGIEPF
ncbi:MAG: hypothetical protein IKW14_03765 [Phascolarctobacterium sp.]|nr:hypothetical protein [Phascolarctobacterium sp.]